MLEIWRVHKILQFFKIPLCLEPQLVAWVKDCAQYVFLGQFDSVAGTERAHLKMPLMHLESIYIMDLTFHLHNGSYIPLVKYLNLRNSKLSLISKACL